MNRRRLRLAFGAVVLAITAIPLALLPGTIVWAFLECGPADSSCHHPPYRLVGAIAVCLALAFVGLRLVLAADPQARRKNGRP